MPNNTVNDLVITRSNKENIAYKIIFLLSVLGTIGVFMLDPIAQDNNYHLFKDQRNLLGIPNFWNVVSNLPFIIIGIMGLRRIFLSKTDLFIIDIKIAYILFFLGVTLVSFGSGYYHLFPSNESLVWDRLPMTIAFMALFSIIIGEFISIRMSQFMLWPLIIFGAISVLYWHYTESNGEGDLRLYILVQFLPMMLIPVILVIFKSKIGNLKAYWLLLSSYVIAKILEYFDGAIYDTIIWFSGHSLKHVIAALGVLILINSYDIQKRSVKFR